MTPFLALIGFSVLAALVLHATVRTLWRRSGVRSLLANPVTSCDQLLDLERALRQTYQDSRIPTTLLAAADFLTVLGVLGIVLAWVYLPTWYHALAATVLLPLFLTALFYHGIEFAGPWWGFPAAYVDSLGNRDEIHDWDGRRCRRCRITRDRGGQ